MAQATRRDSGRGLTRAARDAWQGLHCLRPVEARPAMTQDTRDKAGNGSSEPRQPEGLPGPRP